MLLALAIAYWLLDLGTQWSNSVILCSTLLQQINYIELEYIDVYTFVLTVNCGLETTVLTVGIPLFPMKIQNDGLSNSFQCEPSEIIWIGWESY